MHNKTLDTQFWRRYFKVYDILNSSPSYKKLITTLVEESNAKDGDMILDAGVGTGNLAALLHKKGSRVVGIDFSKEALELCDKKDVCIELHEIDLRSPLPFTDDHFDIVVSNNVLYNIEREARHVVVQELKRVLKPRGTIAIANLHEGFNMWSIYKETILLTFRERGFLGMVTLLMQMIIPTIQILYYNWIINRSLNSGSQKNLFTKNEQKKLLEELGFVDVGQTQLVYAKQGVLNTAKKPDGHL